MHIPWRRAKSTDLGEDGVGGEAGGTWAGEELSHTALWVLGLKVSRTNMAARVGLKAASVSSTHSIHRGRVGYGDKTGMSALIKVKCLPHPFSQATLV